MSISCPTVGKPSPPPTAQTDTVTHHLSMTSPGESALRAQDKLMGFKSTYLLLELVKKDYKIGIHSLKF